ncbi:MULTISPECIES: hypothetical protein [Mycolicibacter]|uniref:Uncharacterized protein n=1 Tax=Mycolicibacter longobardus TaxID=1108812 RepID=A0A1X1YBW8_9MYCO|nr:MULTISPECIES: hypothetical protein [Mycolicibacter]ORW08555.1 hypothetical protein AWC16_19350 [Mycolicibacter longobardus]RAV04332.1 hypothetical protein DQP56_00500 [Mycolicibacter senuensis]
MIRTLRFEHEGTAYRAEVDDNNDSESSDTVEVYGPDDRLISDYDTCEHTDEAVIAEARNEIR